MAIPIAMPSKPMKLDCTASDRPSSQRQAGRFHRIRGSTAVKTGTPTGNCEDTGQIVVVAMVLVIIT